MQYILIVAAVLFLLCRLNSTCKFMIKYALFHLYIVFIFSISIIPCMLRPGSADNLVIGKVIYHMSHIVWWLFGFKIVTEGKENFDSISAPAVLMCNHQSSLDCLIIAKDAPRSTATLAKKSLFYVPLFGWASWLAGTVFIERSSSSAINVMRKLVDDLKRKKANVWIFPEGTRCQNDSMLPFKKGGFHLAVAAQIPIVPIVAGNCRNFIDIPNKIFDSGTLRVKVLQPIQTTGMTEDDVTKLANNCRDVMLKEYEKIMQDHKDEYVNMKPLPNLVKED